MNQGCCECYWFKIDLLALFGVYAGIIFHLPYLVGSIFLGVVLRFFGTRFMRCRSVLTARSPDWQCLLGTFLFGARYPAWWSDAERQDDWRPRIGIKKRFRRMKSKIRSRKLIRLSLQVTGLSSPCPDLCTDQHNDQGLFDADFLLLYLSCFCRFMIPIVFDRWLAGGGDDAFNTLLDFGEWSFCSFPQWSIYIYIHSK